MLFSTTLAIVGVTIICKLAVVSSHGRLMEPPNRSSLWRFPEFEHLEPEKNYNDNQLFCGNRTFQLEIQGGKCGVCGDPYNEAVPRANEDGGIYGRGILVRAYRSGDIMPVEVELTANHKGHFIFCLCAKDDSSSHLDQACYDEHVLELADGSGTKYIVPVNEPYVAKYNLSLPRGVNCKHCVVQWHYETGNHNGYCDDGSHGLGCGPQENFRGCSDIIIYPETEENFDRNPNSRLDTVSNETNIDTLSMSAPTLLYPYRPKPTK